MHRVVPKIIGLASDPVASKKHRKLPGGMGLWAILLVALSVLFLIPPSVAAGKDSVEPSAFNIPAGRLGSALNALALQAGITLVFDPQLAEGQSVQGLHGTYAITDALAVLLAGSGLQAHREGPSAYRIAPEGEERDAMVVIPTLQVQETAVAGAGAQVISGETMHRNLSTDMKDIFRNESSVEIGGGTRAAQRIYVRGLEATNLNVTVDGASQGMNHFQHRGNIGGIDPDLLKQVTLQTLPSADQGPGALGGSIRLETVDAQDLLAAEKRVGAVLRGGYSSVDQGERKGISVFGRAGDHTGLLVHYTKSTFDLYKDGEGNKVVGSEGEDTSLFLKLSMLDLAGHSLRVSAEHHKDQGLYTGDWTYGDGTARTPENQVSERRTYIFDHRLRPAGSQYVDWNINAYLSESTLERGGGETSSEGKGLTLKNTARIGVGPTQHALTFGADWKVETGKAISAAGERNPTDVDVETKGVFIQNRMTYWRVLLSVGARFDDFDTTFGPIQISDTVISPNAGVDIDLGFGFSGFAAYGEASRSAGIIPIGWLVNTTEDATVNTQEGKDSYGKPFKAERAKTWEYGLRFTRQGLFLATDRLNTQVTLFDTDIENLVNQIGGTQGRPVTGFYNDDPLTTKGFEVRLGWGLGGFDTHVSYTHADTQDKDGNAVAFTRRKAASVGDTLVWDNYWQVNPQIGFGYTLKYVSALKRDGIERDGYDLHNAQIQWTPSFLPGVRLAVAVNNLFDKQYRSHASSGDDDTAAPEPGRDIRIGLNYQIQF